MAILCVNLFYKVLIDCSLAILAFLPYLITQFGRTPYRRGFFCDDESIRYPDKPETVGQTELYLVSIPLVLIIVLVTEYTRLPSMVRGKQALQQCLLTSYHVCIFFVFGAVSILSLVSVAKYTVGRLRPNFIEACKPNISCADRDPHEYIENYTCQNEVDDLRMSFFSGHSSWSAFCAVFIAMYLQARVRSPKLVLFKSLLQSLVFYLAFYTALTRISDYKHHPSDVATGLFLGALAAYLTITWAAGGLKLTTWGCLMSRQNSEDNSLLQENNQISYESIESENRE
ncbi:phospholipid phosphatase 1 [Tetranychus urticae]|uniref:Phosphatidic acid phosphatase type 2/haloperoxidase domain-containing protein n=1 Tax=Tetranychus urticae TaxID=32264 RepID=T1K5J9_TETUR|nr:phospholipid phosphatase 1 [Tetranychus urticae]